MQSALDDDSLTTSADGTRLRVALTWIRSLPLACVRGIAVTIDGVDRDVVVLLAGRRVSVGELAAEEGWWYVQDRLVLELPGSLAPGRHDVQVVVQVMIPYLLAGPGGSALELPLRSSARLELDHARAGGVSRDVA